MTTTELLDVPTPGTLLAGKYAVVRVLGKGGMGVVVEARHLGLQQSVALKILNRDVREMADVRERFEREARAAARLQGPHVARILDVGALADGTPFMVMELLRGRELTEELATRGRLPVRDAVGYVLQACAGMAEAHRAGIVHRDIKPSNLFLCEHDGAVTVKVLDFGISKLDGDVKASVTTTASAFGTPLYMSPEQVRSAKHVDARADIWSLGVVLYELLAGESPFAYPSATAILAAIIADNPIPLGKRRPDVPAPLAAAVQRALAKDPSARFADVQELAAAIAPYGPARDDPAMAAITAELASARLAAPATTALGGLAAPARAPSTAAMIGGALLGAAAVLAVILLAASSSRRAQVDPRPDVHPSAQPVAATPTVSPADSAAASPEPKGAPAPTAAPVVATATPRPKPSATARPARSATPRAGDPNYL